MGNESHNMIDEKPTKGIEQEFSVINVFISHKHEDESAAKTIKQILTRYAGGRLEIFLSEEIPEGTEWLPWIRTHLAKSNLLLLLFTDPTAEWDWCLYEAGLFTRLDGDYHRRVICVHHPKLDPPAPLQHLQAVSGDQENVKSFLDRFFRTSELTGIEPPLNKGLDDGELVRVASELCNLIGPKPERRYYNNYLFLSLAPSVTEDLIQNRQIPGPATVVSNEKSLAMFGLEEKPPDRDKWTWGDLAARAKRPEDRPWIEELSQAIHAAIQGHTAEARQRTFRALRSGKIYHPVLHRRHLEPDGSMVFYVLFIEEVSAGVVNVPMPLGTLITSLTMGRRFRWEVIERYLGLLRAWMPGAETEEGCQQLSQTISNIEREAAIEGLLTPDRLVGVFDSEKDQLAIKMMYPQWENIKNALETAIQATNIQEIQAQLDAMRALNKSFMVMASKRYPELVQKIY